ncbi:sugar ABC transporter substrate-binding protein [Actinophytocola oryzae]|uniref:Monosaccharide ABC transporter substrate-binding protein (CUT2 family) n=1 Tax=Actinophytocola oryzae TaxID=502181 RepID=A0A4R7VVC6_9PSEU|nr:sugar ABC transporter substrate-binding protein [Actinophytocola oryzae]TDV53834.1 monosaccharide ABC transporter substrate-binding protein (CUT2 family) [Actinophytocola oryzae]
MRIPVIVAVVLVIAGCGASSGTGDGAQLGFAVATTSEDFAQQMADGGRYAASRFDGVELRVSGPPGVDGPAEVKLLADLGRTATDGIAVENLAPDLFVRPMADLARKDIPLVAVDTVPLDGSDVETYVGNDNTGIGRMLAEEAIRLLGRDAKGTVVVGTTVPGVPVLDQRARGIKEAFAEELPGVEVLGPFETKIEPTLNFGIWNGLVKANPNALAFLGTGDQDSYNLAKIKQENKGTYLTAGFDLNAATLRAVRDGTNFATLSPEHFMKGAVAIRLLAEAATQDKELPRGWIDSGALLVTKDNVDEVIARQDSVDEWFGPRLDDFFADLDSHLRPLREAS